MINILRILVISFCLLMPTIAKATAQQPDEIILSGKSYRLQTNPLDDYLEREGWKPPEEANIWSSNWRGYIAIWVKKGSLLVLKDITIRVNDPDGETPADELTKSIFTDLFPNQDQAVATWYSGSLIIPVGEMVEYVHMGYGTTYSKYEVLKVKNGIIWDCMSFGNEEFESYKKLKFDDFKKTLLYQEALSELITGEEPWSTKGAENFMYDFFVDKYLSQ